MVQNATEEKVEVEVWLQFDEDGGENAAHTSLQLSPHEARSARIEVPAGRYTLTTALDRSGAKYEKSIDLNVGRRNGASAALTVLRDADSLALSLARVAEQPPSRSP